MIVTSTQLKFSAKWLSFVNSLKTNVYKLGVSVVVYNEY